MNEQTAIPTTKKKKTSKPKADKKTKAPAKAEAEKQEAKETQEDLVVFAFRLSQAERDAIHKTAGPARASRYVRRVAAAFATEDVEAFKVVLKEAREARS